MKFRIFAISVFLFGAFSLVMSLYLNGSRNRMSLDPEFVAVTTAIDDDNFDDITLANEKPIVLDFYGDYCVICRKLEPMLLAIAKDYRHKIDIARVNVEESPLLVQRFEVEQVPTLVMLHRGERLFQGTGTSSITALKAFLDSSDNATDPRFDSISSQARTMERQVAD